jgi:hypothetical protein
MPSRGRRVACVALALLCALAASPAGAMAPAGPGGGPLRIAVFALDGFDLPSTVEMVPVQLTTLLVSELERRGHEIVRPSLSPSDFSLALDCTTVDDACLAKMAKHLGVDALFLGSVVRAGAAGAPAATAAPAPAHPVKKKKGPRGPKGPKLKKPRPAPAATAAPASTVATSPVTLRVTLRAFSLTARLESRVHDEEHAFVPGSIAATVDSIVTPFLPAAAASPGSLAAAHDDATLLPPAGLGPDGAPSPGVEAAAPPRARGLRVPALVIAGAGAVLLGGGVVMGFRTASYNSAYEDGANATVDDLIALDRIARRGRTAAILTDVLFAAGAVAIGAGAALFAASLRGPKAEVVVAASPDAPAASRP